MQNTNVNLDTGLYYSLNYYGEPQYGDSIIFPWYVDKSDQDKDDFTGEILMNNYSKTAMDLGDGTARLGYDAINVIQNANYKIFAFVFGKDGSAIDLRKERTQNLNSNYNIVKNSNSLDIDSLDEILTGIDTNVLCITRSSNNMNTRVFVNENKLIEDMATMN
jgi:hypothetical protein